MKALTVAKFGGTSVADHAAMTNCAQVIKSDANRRLVVVSACSGVTNLLVALANGLDQTQRVEALMKIKEIHFSILANLSENVELNQEINSILDDLATLSEQAAHSPSDKLTDKIVANGELLSSHVVAHLFNDQGLSAVRFDVRDVLKTDSQFGNAQPNLAEIMSRAKALLLPLCETSVVITQGFIGSDLQGETTTLGRGGSDYSAALLAEALAADTLEIWTDVPGIYTTDPRIASAAHAIDELSFVEASEMANFGAKILHPATLLPAMRCDIPVFVGSSKAAEQGGTWVRRTATQSPLFRALALRNNQTMVKLTAFEGAYNAAWLMQVFSILAKYKVSVDLVTSSENQLSFVLDKTLTGGGAPSLPQAAEQELQTLCHINAEQDLSLVALVGNHFSQTPGISANIFAKLNNYQVKMIGFGASEHTLCFVVNSYEAKDIIQTLHQALFE